MFAEEFLPTYDVSDAVAVAVVVEASTVRTWDALMEVDLIDAGRRKPLVGILTLVRMLPDNELSVRALPDGRTLLSGLMRTATTDDHPRRMFRRYWTFGVGSGAHVLVNGVIDGGREIAASGGTADDPAAQRVASADRLAAT